MSEKFDSLNLKKELIDNLDELNFNEMTPVQSKSLPYIIDGKDVLAQAKTGSGKTAAFGLGLLNLVDVKNTRPQSLILCPTRELAEQVAKEIRTLARMLRNIKVLTITGGTSEYHQERSLAHGAHLIVGTPGRVLKLLKKKVLILGRVHSFVLDEADRMLDMGFYEDILRISKDIPKVRQTLLFSATFSDQIKELGKNLQNNAIEVIIDTVHEKNTITQKFFEIDSHKNKLNALLKVISHYRPERLIIFCKTKAITDQVAKFLNRNNIYAAGIHGDLMQNERTVALTMFANHSLTALVATDVAARGLDISDLEIVINYDLPFDPEIYTHRIGRTARAGKTGTALSFFISKEDYLVEAISDYQNEKHVPLSIDEIIVEQDYDLLPKMGTIFISGGKKDKLRPGDIVGALIGEAKISFEDIGNISVLNILSYVAINAELVDDVILKLGAGKIKNRKFRVGLA